MTTLDSQIDTPFLKAIGSGALAAMIGLIMRYGLVQITGAQLNFVAAGLGWAVGLKTHQSRFPGWHTLVRALDRVIH